MMKAPVKCNECNVLVENDDEHVVLCLSCAAEEFGEDRAKAMAGIVPLCPACGCMAHADKKTGWVECLSKECNLQTDLKTWVVLAKKVRAAKDK